MPQLRIHPWSLLGGYGDWDEAERDRALRIGVPPAWTEALGPREGPAPVDDVELREVRLPAGFEGSLALKPCPALLIRIIRPPPPPASPPGIAGTRGSR